MIDNKVLYKVGDEQLPGFWSLGLDVEIGDGWVGFHTTQRGHSIDGYLVEETMDGFIWQRMSNEDGKIVPDGRLTFKVITLEEFNREWRPKVYFGNDIPEFASDLELYEWYRRKFGDLGMYA